MTATSQVYKTTKLYTDPTTTRTSGSPRTPAETVERTRALRAITDRQAVVYAIRLDDGTIKIGSTGNLATRRSEIACHTRRAAEIVGFQFGTPNDETEIHQQLHGQPRRGHYYRPTPSSPSSTRCANPSAYRRSNPKAG